MNINKKNYVFCVLSKEVIYRNIYDTGFWSTFCELTPDIQKVLILPKELRGAFEKKFESKNVLIEEYQKTSWRGWSAFVMFLVRNGIFSHSAKVYRWRAYETGASSFMSTIVKGCVANTLGRFPLLMAFVRRCTEKLPVSLVLEVLFEKYQPSAVFAPSLIDLEFDVPISIAARNRGIPVIGMVRSWDNLNNHGLMPLYPDKFIVQNKWLKEATSSFQGIRAEDLPKDIVGLPHYDVYKDPLAVMHSRDDFFRQLGLDPSKKLILLGGSDFYYSEDTLPLKLDVAIESGAVEKPAQIIFRPHPKSLFEIRDYALSSLNHVVLDDAFSGKTLFSDTEKFINLVYHADVIVNIASTLSIDAAVFDTPAVCVCFDDSAKKLSKYKKVDKLYDSFDHYEQLVETGGVRIAKSEQQLIECINMYLSNPDIDREGRQRMVERFVAPFDGESGERLAKVVLDYTIEYARKMKLRRL